MADDVSFSIELNEKHTRMAECRIKPNSIEITALGYEPTANMFYSSDNEVVLEKEADIISHLHNTLHIRENNAHIIIPDIYTFSRVLEMPRLKEKEMIAAIKYQADEFIPMNIDDTNLDLEVLKEDEKTNKMLVFIVASPKNLVEKIQRTVDLANLTPITLENELSAVARLFSTFFKRIKQSASGTSLLINMGFSTTSLYLFDETSSLLLLSRTFNIGLNIFIKDLMANLNVDETKATQLLANMGVAQNASMNLDGIISPIIREISQEIERFILISKEKYGMSVNELYIFNYDNMVQSLATKLQQSLSLQLQSLKLDQYIVNNPIKQSFANTMTSFISVIAGNIE